LKRRGVIASQEDDRYGIGVGVMVCCRPGDGKVGASSNLLILGTRRSDGIEAGSSVRENSGSERSKRENGLCETHGDDGREWMNRKLQ